MSLPNTAHTSRPWRVHELTKDFRLYDVWALPTPGGPDDFPRLVRQIASGDPSDGASRAGRALWAIRWKVGELLGWDMAAIMPFRYLIVYPPLMREIGREWRKPTYEPRRADAN